MAKETVTISFFNENSAKNAILATLKKKDSGRVLNVFFSYGTPIAFETLFPEERGIKSISRNEWGPTTGKHLNWAGNSIGVDRNEDSVPHEEFMKHLDRVCSKYGFALPVIEI